VPQPPQTIELPNPDEALGGKDEGESPESWLCSWRCSFEGSIVETSLGAARYLPQSATEAVRLRHCRPQDAESVLVASA